MKIATVSLFAVAALCLSGACDNGTSDTNRYTYNGVVTHIDNAMTYVRSAQSGTLVEYDLFFYNGTQQIDTEGHWTGRGDAVDIFYIRVPASEAPDRLPEGVYTWQRTEATEWNRQFYAVTVEYDYDCAEKKAYGGSYGGADGEVTDGTLTVKRSNGNYEIVFTATVEGRQLEGFYRGPLRHQPMPDGE